MNLSEFLLNFQNIKKSGNGYLAHCPGHEDKEQSLSISTGKDNRILLHCHAGCKTSDILAKLKLTEKDLFNAQIKKTIEAVYPYHNGSGKLLYEIIRYNPKSFAVRSKTDNGYQWGLGDLAPILYHLPDIIKAVENQQTIYIVEGEKDVDNLYKIGLVATCNALGAGKWRASYSEALIGTSVVILPDKDEPGRNHALQVAKSLQGKASSTKIIELPGSGKDITDWLESGGTKEKLESLAVETKEWNKSEGTKELQCENRGSSYCFTLGDTQITLSQLREHKDGRFTAQIRVESNQTHVLQANINLTSIRSLNDLSKELLSRKPDVNWKDILETVCVKVLNEFNRTLDVVELRTTDTFQKLTYKLNPVMAEKEPTILYGDGGSGKSYLALVFSICIQLPWLDNPFNFVPKDGKVLYLDWESSGKDRIGIRLQQLLLGLGLPSFLSIHYSRCELPLCDSLDGILQSIVEKKIDTMIIDSLAPACGGDVNSAEVAIAFNQAVRKLNCTTLIIAHQSKTDEGKKSIFGSVFFRNNARLVWQVKSAQEPGSNILDITLSHNKENEGGKKPDIGMQLEFGSDRVIPRRVDVNSVLSVMENLSIANAILELLATKDMSLVELAEQLPETTKANINTTLWKLSYKGKVVKKDGYYAIPS